MNRKSSVGWKTLVVSVLGLAVIVAIHSKAAYAQQTDSLVFSGAICRTPSNNTEGIEWGYWGVRNVGSETQSLVCPLVFNKLADNVDASVRIANRSDSTYDIACRFVVSDPFGDPDFARTIGANIQPNFVVFIGLVDLDIVNFQTLSVTCDLPPGTILSGVTVDLF
jgi:hypothetical protein